MITYDVCDQDGFWSVDSAAVLDHFTTNPTHTSHVGVGGDTCSPLPYSGGGSSTIPEVSSDPVSPTAGQIWLLANGKVGTGGQAMGVLGLTYSQAEVNSYDLSIYTQEGKIIRVRMS